MKGFFNEREDPFIARPHVGERDVAVLAGGAIPPRLTRTNRDPAGAPGSKGDALILRPSLVAGPAGSERRTRRPRRVTNQLPRSNQS